MSYFRYCFLLLFFISKCSSSINLLKAISDIAIKPIQKITSNFSEFIELAAENGYNAEKHEVTTEDGYILTMHRIPPGTNCIKKTPLLVMHGLPQTSEAFLVAGPQAPGYVLAKDCYDVWFGNSRGNYHSRRHVRLNPDKDPEFWKFSIDQMGSYDLPAMMDHILNTTNSKKLIYVGFSQGGEIFFILNSERPEYASKIGLFVGLAPGNRLLNARPEVAKVAVKIVNDLRAPLEAAGVWEIMSKGFPLQAMLSFLCQVELVAAVVCGLTTSLLDSAHPDSITPEIQKRIFQHFPAGTSVQNVAHYGQLAEDESMHKFDYGPDENMKVYGCPDPPEYDLRAGNVPAVIFRGPADDLVNDEDLDWVVSQMPNVLDYLEVEDPLWNHLDMSYSRYWRETIYVTLKEYLTQYDDIY